MRTKLFIVIFAIASALIFSACGDESDSGGLRFDGDSAYVTLNESGERLELRELDKTELAEYQIVRSDIGEGESIDAALAIRRALEENVAAVELTTDWVKRGEAAPTDTPEILVGSTNRLESPAEGELRMNDFVIRFQNNRLIICGGSDSATLRAAEFFIENFIDYDGGRLFVPDGGEYLYRSPVVCESYLLNGVELYEYQISTDLSGGADAIEWIDEFIQNTTGYQPAKESEHKIIVRSDAPDGSCTVTTDGGDIIVSGSGTLDMSAAARFFIGSLQSADGYSPDALSQTVAFTLNEMLSITKEEIAMAEPIEIFIAPNGSDDGDGSEAAPLATIEAARRRAHELTNQRLAPVNIYLRGGDYYLTSPVQFDATDSGIDGAPVSYMAYNNEEVNIYGGVKVDPSLVTKVTDQAILDRLIDKSAADKLMQIDLSGLFDSIPSVYAYGNTSDNSDKPVTVYIAGNPLDRSRWPNSGSDSEYLLTADKVDAHDDGSFTIYYDDAAAERIAKWSDGALDDLHIFGFLSWDWYNEDYKIMSLDKTSKSFDIPGAISYGEAVTGSQRYYYFNLLDEIDQPGESYIDCEKRIVYFYPDDDYDVNDIYVSNVADSLFKFTGTSNIIIDGLNFLYTRGNAVSGDGLANFTLRNCTIAHTSSNGASLSGSDVTVSYCHIYDTNSGGVNLSGGDRKTLTPSGNVVENCEIHDINRSGSTYKPGIGASSFGMVIRNNKLYNCVHEMIAVSSNDIIIEYNDFSSCVTNSSDMGAIYFGRDPSLMGTVIRYNYFHQIGNKYGNVGNKHGGIGQQSIFIDDGNNGAEIYGNVFWEGTYDSAAIKTHGAQFSHMTNNIFVDMPSAYQNSDWGGGSTDGSQLRWFKWLFDRYPDNAHEIIAKVSAVDFTSDLWMEYYKDTIWAEVYDYIDADKIVEYAAMTDAEFEAAALSGSPVMTNDLVGNIFVNIPEDTIYKGGICVLEDNYSTNDTSIFVDYGSDFTLTDDALTLIRETIPEFENIPFENIGIIEK